MASSELPQGTLRRAAVLGGATARAAWRGRRGGASTSSQRDAAAAAIVEALGRLRGTALKMAQLLSLESDLFPPELVVRLQAACSDNPPLSWDVVRRALRDGQGTDGEARFASLDREAFAAASLGQVHRARTHRGEDVVVKVRYPGIERAIRGDVAVLRALFRRLPDSRFLLGALAEFERRLREEVDYRREAAMTAWFGAHLRVDHLRVPAIFPELCGEAFLTTEALPGLHLDAWLATGPSQAARDRAAQALADALTASLHGEGRVHVDPNPGNALFSPDGSVGLLDFGCVRDFPADLVARRTRVLRGLLDGDDEGVLDEYLALGVVPDRSRQRAAEHRRRWLPGLEEWLVRPLRSEVFDFAADAEFAAQGRELFATLASDRTPVTLPRTFVYLDRTCYGLYRTFTAMGARVRLRGLLG